MLLFDEDELSEAQLPLHDEQIDDEVEDETRLIDDEDDDDILEFFQVLQQYFLTH
jgi:hypothetical protein